MDTSQYWWLGLAPHTPMEELQAEIEAMYEREQHSDIPELWEKEEDDEHD